MSKKNPRTRSTKARKVRRGKPRGGTAMRRQPVQVVLAPDGSPFKGDCTCPVCVDLARQGIPQMTMDANGELVEVPRPELPPMIEVVVRGTPSTWPELPVEARTVSVPSGCVVQDLLEYLCYRDLELRRAFPPGGLSASIAGERCEDQRVVRAGDELRVSGRRDREWS
ncbi:MAG TPA: hypothetical protein VML75_08910, partial [Kofleriaceae bacterium]|nr:hypothetical protein [Kofleriaceae bacterium]